MARQQHSSSEVVGDQGALHVIAHKGDLLLVGLYMVVVWLAALVVLLAGT